MTGTDIHDRLRDISTGQFDLPENRLPGADQNPDIRFGRSIAGRGGGSADDSAQQKNTFWEGVGALTALAGAAAGLLIGANFYDGDNTVMTLLVMAGAAVLVYSPALCQFSC